MIRRIRNEGGMKRVSRQLSASPQAEIGVGTPGAGLSLSLRRYKTFCVESVRESVGDPFTRNRVFAFHAEYYFQLTS